MLGVCGTAAGAHVPHVAATVQSLFKFAHSYVATELVSALMVHGSNINPTPMYPYNNRKARNKLNLHCHHVPARLHQPVQNLNIPGPQVKALTTFGAERRVADIIK